MTDVNRLANAASAVSLWRDERSMSFGAAR